MTNQKILGKLLLILKEIEYVQKDKKNSMQGYNYLSESKIKEIIKANLEKYNVLFTYSTDNVREYEISPTSKGTKQFVTSVNGKYQFSDCDSGEVIEGCWAGAGSDTGDKGIYKAITGGIKYVFNTTFLIPTGDDPEDDKEAKEEVKKPIVTENHKSVFTEEQKANMKKVYTIFHITKDYDLNKYVEFWAKQNNKTEKTYRDIKSDNIDDFCKYILAEGHKVVPF